MRSKYIAGLLAIFLGVFGIHRFYLGQFIRGAIYLLFPPVCTVVFFIAMGQEESISHIFTDFGTYGLGFLNIFFFAHLLFYLPIVLISLFDAVYFFLMPMDRFNIKFNSTSENRNNSIIFSLAAFIVSVVILILIYNAFFSDRFDDVRDAEPDHIVTSVELAGDFTDDEDAAFARYENSIIRMTGTIIDKRIDVGTQAYSLLFEGNDWYEVLVHFVPGDQELVRELEYGQLVRIKGQFHQVMNFEITIRNAVWEETMPEVMPEREGLIMDTLPAPIDTPDVPEHRTRVEIDTPATLPE